MSFWICLICEELTDQVDQQFLIVCSIPLLLASQSKRSLARASEPSVQHSAHCPSRGVTPGPVPNWRPAGSSRTIQGLRPICVFHNRVVTSIAAKNCNKIALLRVCFVGADLFGL